MHEDHEQPHPAASAGNGVRPCPLLSSAHGARVGRGLPSAPPKRAHPRGVGAGRPGDRAAACSATAETHGLAERAKAFLAFPVFGKFCYDLRAIASSLCQDF
jgi:hypothetical protein